MLSAANRLRLQRDFDRVYKQGRTVNGPLFNLKYVPNNLPDSRFSFVISSKVEKLATRRNLIRRRLRAAVALLQGGVKPGFDVVILIKKAALAVPYQDLAKQVEIILRQARLIAR